MYNLAKRGLSAFAVSALLSGAAFAGDLVINFDDPNPAPKAGFEAAVEAFKAANPDINVTVNINDREAHKTAIRNGASTIALTSLLILASKSQRLGTSFWPHPKRSKITASHRSQSAPNSFGPLRASLTTSTCAPTAMTCTML